MISKIRSWIRQIVYPSELRRDDDTRENDFDLVSLDVSSARNEGQQRRNEEDITIIWLTQHTEIAKQNTLLQSLRSINDFIQVCHSEIEALNLLESAMKEKVFLIIDYIDDTLFSKLTAFKKIDSLFVLAPKPPDVIPACVTAFFSDEISLINGIKEAQTQVQKQIAVFSIYNQTEKSIRDLTRESGSFLFFQLFKNVLLNMTQSSQAKQMMISKCRDYYRGNPKEMHNIDNFERNYKSSDAIQWYTDDLFVYRRVNKALRTEDIEVLYHFRFYIIDLCKELERCYKELKHQNTENVLHLYRGLQVSSEEFKTIQESVGNLISVNGYLSSSRNRQIAYHFATMPTKRENVVRVIFEYTVDFASIETIILAEIVKYSKFPEEEEMLFDLGAAFQIESCIYSTEEDLWIIKAHATDKGTEVASEYIEYQKAKVAESTIILMFGHLLIETGEYLKAEKYFHTILQSSNPNDEEIACIYHNIGQAYRLRGEYQLAFDYLHRSSKSHFGARPPRLISAAKTINSIGIIYIEQGFINLAEQSFKHAFQLYAKTVHQNHPDIGGTLINLAGLYCQKEQYEEALSCFTRAHKIYQHSLPRNHPYIAYALNNLGILHYRENHYDLALDAFVESLTMKEMILPVDHPDVARTVHNIAIIYAHRGDYDQAKLYFKRAATCNLPETHPFMNILKNNMAIWEIVVQTGIPFDKICTVGMDQNLVLRF